MPNISVFKVALVNKALPDRVAKCHPVWATRDLEGGCHRRPQTGLELGSSIDAFAAAVVQLRGIGFNGELISQRKCSSSGQFDLAVNRLARDKSELRLPDCGVLIGHRRKTIKAPATLGPAQIGL